MKITFSLNGTFRTVDVPPLMRLLDVLRETLGLTGTKEGCGEGECGTCTVLLDGLPVNACLVAAGQCDGRTIVTIEGLGRDGNLSPMQEAFVHEGGTQCGFCTPGFLMSLAGAPSGEIGKDDRSRREAVAGNICRCTGYQRIVEAIRTGSPDGDPA